MPDVLLINDMFESQGPAVDFIIIIAGFVSLDTRSGSSKSCLLHQGIEVALRYEGISVFLQSRDPDLKLWSISVTQIVANYTELVVLGKNLLLCFVSTVEQNDLKIALLMLRALFF